MPKEHRRDAVASGFLSTNGIDTAKQPTAATARRLIDNGLPNMVSKHNSVQRTVLLLARSALGLACALNSNVAASGQEPAAPPAPQSQTEQDLTEGLLDLLTEPDQEPPKTPAEAKGSAADEQAPTAQGTPAGASPAAPSTTPPLDGARGLGAKDFGAEDLSGGEDLGASRANPLAEVRLGMLTAAGWLRDQSAVDKTEQLQRDIVARLDQLIDDLSQQSPTPSPPPPADSQTPPPSESPQPSESQEGSGKESDATKSAGEKQTADETGKSEQTQADASGTEGQPTPGGLERKGVVVDLNDPTALQRSAWGNLPDRVREQMQSRMVERFLPGYREEIEAYYRALSR